MKLSDIRQTLTGHGIQLTKSLGQNFLHDANQLRRIAQAAELGPADKVLEIGPGLGPLTELLVESAGRVLAIEMDARLLRVLGERFQKWTRGETPKLELVRADALEYLRHERRDWGEWKLVANLPYSVASPLLVELAQGKRGPRRIAVTLQLEVARRLMARPGDKEHGVLTLLVQLDYQPLALFKIPASCFFPEPDVDSACVSLARRPHPLLPADQRAIFAKIVKRGFSQRRKMMLKLLKEDWPAPLLDSAFQKLGLAPEARAETVALEEFVALARAVAAASPDA